LIALHLANLLLMPQPKKCKAKDKLINYLRPLATANCAALEVIAPGNVASASARDVREALSQRAIVNLRLGRLWLH
jgi:hypothetical protein